MPEVAPPIDTSPMVSADPSSRQLEFNAGDATIVSGDQITRLRLRLASVLGRDRELASRIGGGNPVTLEIDLTILNGRVVAISVVNNGGDPDRAQSLKERISWLVQDVEMTGFASRAAFHLSLVLLANP
ncbi:MAG: hypothetical protein JNJ44_03845 [Zoogloeaceae bacterium]|nr:hypothetical protein [Zoogloeaceae bacterium]